MRSAIRLAALERFEEAYVEQRYSARPTSAEVTARSRRSSACCSAADGVDEILTHPTLAHPRRSRRAAAARRLPIDARFCWLRSVLLRR